MHFTNQTLRQIVRTQHRRIESARRAQQRLRHGARHDRRAPTSRFATRTASIQASGRPLTFSGKADDHDSRQRRRSTATRSTLAVPQTGGSRHRSVPARHDQRAGDADDAHRRAPDQLHLGDRQPRRQADLPAGGHDAELVPALAGRRRGAGRRPAPIVAFGDSITDGARSTPDTNNRWPDHLAGVCWRRGSRWAC